MVPRSGKCLKCSRHGGMLGKCSRVNINVFLRKGLSLGLEPRAMGRNRWETMGMAGSVGAKGPAHGGDMIYKLGNHTRNESKCFR